MTFPGGVQFTTPEQLAEWAKGRYQWVKKSYDGFDEMATESGEIVYCFGSLEGVWPDGKAFSKIRFIDRFTVTNSLIVDQQVWNDLGEIRHE